MIRYLILLLLCAFPVVANEPYPVDAHNWTLNHGEVISLLREHNGLYLTTCTYIKSSTEIEVSLSYFGTPNCPLQVVGVK